VAALQPVLPPIIQAPIQAVVSAPAAPAPIVSENLEHGRKITVKRRMLPNENGTEGPEQQAPATGTAETGSEANTASQESASAPQSQERPSISFGRR
jgi:hypothetical protein